MRMCYDPDDEDGFEAGRDLLVDRLERWAARCGEPGGQVDAFAVAAALDYRHLGTPDGRLGLWEPRHVKEFLLDWAPRTITVLPDEELPDAPGALRLLLRFLHAAHLADPRGPGLNTQLAAVDEAVRTYREAMADRTRFGPAKFWLTLAAEHGSDTTSQEDLDRFVERVHAGEIDHDEAALAVIARRHLVEGPADARRSEPQLPVALPSEQELRADAERITLLTQVRLLTEWAGRQGRPLTTTGRLKTADARDLADRLATGDAPTESVRSLDDLPRLNLVLELARQARLVRVVKGRLYAVAKAAPELKDPLALWRRAFDAVFGLRRPLLGAKSGWHVESLLFDTYEDTLADILNTLYSLPHPMPWPRLRDSVDYGHRVRLRLDDQAPAMWFDHAHRDLRRLLDVLDELGAVERTRGRPAPEYLEVPAYSGMPAPPPGTHAALVALLPEQPPAPAFDTSELDGDSVELIGLSALGTWAVRARLLDEGRDAPLVGELRHATAAGLLGVLADHYDTDSARSELTGWTEAHDDTDHARAQLLGAVRDMPFRSRAQAMLDTLLVALPEPEGERLVRSLRGDPRLAPYAIGVLVQRDLLDPDDLTDTESLVMVAEGMLQLLEITGPEGLAQAALTRDPDLRDAIEAALAAPHPDRAALAELEQAAARLPRTGRARGERRRRGRGAGAGHGRQKRGRGR
ncbi:hypothetical protein ABTY98_01060 [Streptomyces sp. NPDC096040]|uniref:hypothetical protein n=1 Tax=Streptomyces sp. NPDC096040 TaxID=3155541 RepID=UPI0033244763